jgi:hypothetical protein
MVGNGTKLVVLPFDASVELVMQDTSILTRLLAVVKKIEIWCSFIWCSFNDENLFIVNFLDRVETTLFFW